MELQDSKGQKTNCDLDVKGQANEGYFSDYEDTTQM